MSRGEVWWARPADGSRRPYLVITRNGAIPYLHAVLAIPATRSERGIPTEVALDEDDGMPVASVLSVDNLALLDHEWFDDYICKLSDIRMREVCRAIAVATGCA